MTTPRAPISWGELFDKITILEIKSERLTGKAALANVANELAQLTELAAGIGGDEVTVLKSDLKRVNERLWQIEDDIRAKEAAKAFDAGFIELARAVYRHNDERARLKGEINRALNSELVEEKQYSKY